MDINNIYSMDCLKGLKQVKDHSIDLVVTDVPYLTYLNTREMIWP